MVNARKKAPRTKRAPRIPSPERRVAILQAFVEEAVAIGSIEGVSMRNLGARAGCAPLIAYRLFGSRKGLVQAALGASFSRVAADLTQAAASEMSATLRLARVASALERRPPGTEAIFEALALSAASRDPEHGRTVRRLLEGLVAQLCSVLADGIRQGEFAPDLECEAIAWRLVGIGVFRSQCAALGLRHVEALGVARHSFDSVMLELRGARPAAKPQPRSKRRNHEPKERT